jgi:hypothetical protein
VQGVDVPEQGEYNVAPWYLAGYHYLWRTTGGEWRLSDDLGGTCAYFTKDAPSGEINGTYSPGTNATGTPTVGDGAAKWTFAEDTNEEPPLLTVVVEYEVAVG